MKKLVIFMMLFVFSVVLSLNFSYAATPNTLVIHYYRYDDIYDHTFWMWESKPIGNTGKEFTFNPSNKDEHGVYFEVNLGVEYPSATEVGIIIKKGAGWSGEREPGGDRFISLSDIEVKNGKAHAYFVQGSVKFATSDADLENGVVEYGATILYNGFARRNNKFYIDVNLSNSAVDYKVYASGEQVQSGVFGNGLTHSIEITSLDLSKTYEIEVNFGDKVSRKFVQLSGIYDTPEFEEEYTYNGQLGAIYSKEKTTFRVWAPLASELTLNLYNQGHPNYDRLGNPNQELLPYETHDFVKIENGAWEVEVDGDLDAKYYTFSVTNYEITSEVTDPYSYSTGANGLRSMVVNFDKTDPANWEFVERPQTIVNFTDYIIWELHVRDLTTHSSWGGNQAWRGKFLGLSQGGTSYTQDGVTVTTGLDHIEELGVNAVHLLPIFDFGYVDEVELFQNPNATKSFNWGYMPYHFNTLEGSYSTNPFDGYVRMYEFKQAVKAMSDKGIRVIMDVVYNHTAESEGSNFNKLVPGYYHRLTSNGSFSNGSGTGNETASERSMFRKFMIDSTTFLVTEYKLSGLRFDLMSLHDVDTMNEIRQAMNAIDPTIILYGEPWAGGDTLIDGSIAAGMTNTNGWDRTQIRKLDNGVAAFNDLLRNALKGDPDGQGRGFLQGDMDYNKMQDLRKGIMGATDQFTNQPTQNIVYNEAHDNLTLHDKLRNTGFSAADVKFGQMQSNAIVLTSMGIPFLHAGTEFLRSKPLQGGGYEHNSYESPDSVNQLRWDRKLQYNEVFEFTKALIHIRKTYSGLRMSTTAEIQSRFEWVTTSQDGSDKALAFKIKGTATEPTILVIHAGKTSGATNVTLSDGKTYMQLTGRAGTQALYDTEKGLVSRKGNISIGSQNTSAIFVEVMSTDKASIKSQNVNIELGASFNALSNVNIPTGSQVYASSIDTSIPGFKLVTVIEVDYLGNKNILFYTVNVAGGRFTGSITVGGLA